MPFTIATSAGPSAGEVRELVLFQHRELRKLIERVCQATEGVELSFERAEQVVRIAEELQSRLGNHLTFEERFLFPALGDADAWGPQRVAALSAEHIRQRHELEAFIDLVEAMRPPEEVSHALRILSASLLDDMADEESAFVNERVLRDDLVCVDQASS